MSGYLTRRRLLYTGAGLGALASAAWAGNALHEASVYRIHGIPVKFKRMPDGHLYYSRPSFPYGSRREDTMPIVEACCRNPDYEPPPNLAEKEMVRREPTGVVDWLLQDLSASWYRRRHRQAQDSQ